MLCDMGVERARFDNLIFKVNAYYVRHSTPLSAREIAILILS